MSVHAYPASGALGLDCLALNLDLMRGKTNIGRPSDNRFSLAPVAW